jgi:biopolymer transport protein TolR
LKLKRHLTIEHGLSTLDIAPFINILLLLFVFFMLIASMAAPSGIIVNLPKAVPSDVIKEKSFIITVTSEDVLYLNNTIVTIKELEKEFLKSSHQQKSVLIKADRRVSVGRIVDVWNLCRKAGIEKINIATNEQE